MSEALNINEHKYETNINKSELTINHTRLKHVFAMGELNNPKLLIIYLWRWQNARCVVCALSVVDSCAHGPHINTIITIIVLIYRILRVEQHI